MPETAYNEAFYDQQADGSALSAKVVLGCLFERYAPSSAVDVGCGVGTWLAACRDMAVPTLLGVDGEYVDRTRMRIDDSLFRSADITDPAALAAATGGARFDLAISLEVAEHLDPMHAASFVDSLTELSDVVLFSAAIPYQGGTHHVNEAWPEFWAILFRARGYEVVDLFRDRLWGDRRVSFWYRQNAVVYVRRDSEAMKSFVGAVGLRFPLSAVHPEMLAWASARLGRAPEGNLDRDREIHAGLVVAYRNEAERPPPRRHAYGPEFDYRYGGLKERLPDPVRRAAKALLRVVAG
ncbi:methyltransferase domain-containing protein [Methylorubrum extorquens]|jgi:hypothetical protein|uniref:Methyltransferase domain-containing protein n=1 Tax=Methylorubrum extorquens (strain ATCC 14718 / DSM 1338 / JCM 2805 / NCIMB 9133 / AM1) TaxID=272630 RepID=C5B4A7_METEA|nr:methyltransferase domain-containing protein [Methylorubrum extorquens]ACS43289.1 conserved hypothetical protein [Methylorubrum extorquens AM1]MCP1545617.1 hypothetical protein [Methylorubrum extorquens]MCP1591568.1 hypothetical protein [Methylorubrum extorquens]